MTPLAHASIRCPVARQGHAKRDPERGAMDHLPLYRQHEIFERMGADIPESTLIGWVKDRSRRDQTVRGTV